METSKVKVMILGVDHFGSVGQHLMKHDVEDVLSEEKQKEINELLDKLSKFKPTKIAVEGRKDKDEEYNLEYIKYCMKKVLEKNPTIEERNEIFQIGFKLGQKLGHERIYPVDSPLSIPMEEVLEYTEKNCFKKYEEFMKMVKKYEEEVNEIKKDKTIREYFRYLNSNDRFSKEHSNFYLFLNKIGAADNYCGAEMMTEWYRRNLRIFSNIQDIAQEGDRVLVIYGAGHCKILQQLVYDFNDMELVDPLNYL